MMRPLRDRILVLPDVRPTQSPGGLHLVPHWDPDRSGTVIAVGGGARCPQCGHGKSAPVAVGDHVLFGLTAGTRVILEGTAYLLLHFDDLLATMETPDAA